MKRSFAVSVLALAGFGIGSLAHAAPTTCLSHDPDPHPEGLSVSDVTWEGNPADDCYGLNSSGPGGTVSASDANDAWGGAFGGGVFTSVLKEDDEQDPSELNGSFAGVDFTIRDTSLDQLSGTFALDWSCNGLCPITLDMVVGLKGAPVNALYLFDDVEFGALETGSGTFLMAYTFQANGNAPASTPELSNLAVLFREGTPTQVPEPGTLALLGAGLLGLGLMRRRRAA